MKLYHCRDSRSLRPLWALEEMGLAYEMEDLPFPPRVFRKEYLGVNPLGTVFSPQLIKVNGIAVPMIPLKEIPYFSLYKATPGAKV